MNLEDKTIMLKQYCKAAKQNFFKMGEILTAIRDNALFKEQYDTFTEYLESNEFEFSRQYAYKLIEVWEEFGNVNTCLQLHKLMALTHVTDKEQREVLMKKAETSSVRELKDEVKKLNTEKLYSSIHRKSQREDSDVETKEDSKLDKAKRIGNSILDDLEGLKTPLNEMKSRIESWIKDFSQYSTELETLKSAIIQKNSELKSI